MRDAHGPVSIPCTDRSGDECSDVVAAPEILATAYLDSPIGNGLRAEIKRSRKLTPAKGLEKAARLAVAASMLLEGRGPGGVT